MTLDDPALFVPTTAANPGAPEPRRCRRHTWAVGITGVVCTRCPAVQNLAAVRRGRNNKARGGRHELAVARLYGGEKVGPLGGPDDIRGAQWRTQLKTHKGEPPAWLTAPFRAMDGQSDGRAPRVIHRWLPGPGVKPIDIVMVEGHVVLDHFGRDE